MLGLGLVLGLGLNLILTGRQLHKIYRRKWGESDTLRRTTASCKARVDEALGVVRRYVAKLAITKSNVTVRTNIIQLLFSLALEQTLLN